MCIRDSFFTDPVRMAVAIEGITEFLAQSVEGVDVDVLRANADSYVSELTALDAELTAMFDDLSQDQRKIVTNHEVFGYFADRYDFEVIGTIVPSGSTTDGVSGQELAELAEVIENEGVPQSLRRPRRQMSSRKPWLARSEILRSLNCSLSRLAMQTLRVLPTSTWCDQTPPASSAPSASDLRQPWSG